MRGISTLDQHTFRDSDGNLRRPWGYPNGKGKPSIRICLDTSNLISFWGLDGISGDVVDSHGSNTGTNYGATRGASGKIESAFSFDGTDDYVNIGTPGDLTNAMESGTWSISGWFNTADSGWKELYAYDSGKSGEGRKNIIIYNSLIHFLSGSGSASDAVVSNNTLADSLWHHFVAVRDGATIQLYIDGVLNDSTTRTSNSSSQTNVNIGGWNFKSRFFAGKIDSLGVWDIALTSEDVATLYNSGDGLPY